MTDMTIAEFIRDNTRLQNKLYASGITTVAELLELSDSDLRKLLDYNNTDIEQVNCLLIVAGLRS